MLGFFSNSYLFIKCSFIKPFSNHTIQISHYSLSGIMTGKHIRNTEVKIHFLTKRGPELRKMRGIMHAVQMVQILL